MQYEELHNRFTHHKPNEEKGKKHGQIRNDILTLAANISNLCPQGRELSLALTKLEEAMFWANAAIARQE